LQINTEISQEFWDIFKGNITFIHEIIEWIDICFGNFRNPNKPQDQEFLKQCLEVLPEITTDPNSWQLWLDGIKKISPRKGKELFMPIRLALSGKESGLELKHLINFISRQEIIARFS
jgi:glutamyl-tRNA synthetase